MLTVRSTYTCICNILPGFSLVSKKRFPLRHIRIIWLKTHCRLKTLSGNHESANHWPRREMKGSFPVSMFRMCTYPDFEWIYIEWEKPSFKTYFGSQRKLVFIPSQFINDSETLLACADWMAWSKMKMKKRQHHRTLVQIYKTVNVLWMIHLQMEFETNFDELVKLPNKWRRARATPTANVLNFLFFRKLT